MLQLRNQTGLAAAMLCCPDPDGIDCLYTIVKGTFRLPDTSSLADEQVPVQLEERYTGEPGSSSVRAPSDLGLMKPGTDVLLSGQAYAPGGRPTAQMDVTLAVGPVRAALRVFGDRSWKRGIGSPAPFETMPLVWERAFGGTWTQEGKPLQAENRNPVGTGFQPDGGALPNLEDPRQLISGSRDRPTPVNFGPICAHWEPRRTYAGTYDEAWQRQRAPYLPCDFNPAFFQLAPPYLVSPGHLRGGEPAEITGVTPAGRLKFELPRMRVEVRYYVGDRVETRPAALDTVILQPDLARLLLVWRAFLHCDKRVLRVREVEIRAAQER